MLTYARQKKLVGARKKDNITDNNNIIFSIFEKKGLNFNVISINFFLLYLSLALFACRLSVSRKYFEVPSSSPPIGELSISSISCGTSSFCRFFPFASPFVLAGFFSGSIK